MVISRYHPLVAQLIVRNLEEDIKAALKHRAQLHGHSLEEEVRQVLRRSVAAGMVPASGGLGSRIAARFSGGRPVGLDEPLPELHGQAAQAMAWGGPPSRTGRAK